MERVRELWDFVTANQYVGSALILIISLVAAVVADLILGRFCRRFCRRTKTTIDDSFVDLIHSPVRVSVVLIGLWLVTQRLELPPKPEFVTTAMLKTIAVLLWTVFGVRVVSMTLTLFSRSDRLHVIDTRTSPLFINLAKVILIAGALYFVFLFWDINVSAWLASAGIIGLAIGFAAKDTLANLFSGIFILADAPYKLGDYINLDTGERGEVTHIGLRSTRLLTRDDVEITIPNAVIANAKIINESGGPWARERIRIKVGVAYGTDADRLREILEDIGARHPETCDDPAPRVRFRAFGNSSIDFELLCWIEQPVLRGRVVDALNTEIYKRFAREGIEIPYPKRDVYIKQMPGTRPDE